VKRTLLAAAAHRALAELRVPLPGQSVVVGLSGGPDSVALLDVLAGFASSRGFRVVAAHLDHALRYDSAEDAAFCRDLCARMGIPFHTARADVRSRAARDRGGVEEAARRERYEFLNGVKEREGAAYVAVAHTRDDQAETLLLRLLRGAGSQGLAAMKLRSGDLIRPLLRAPRVEVLQHLVEKELPWREDPTNKDPGLLRNRIRLELIPLLEQRFNPQVRDALARSATLLGDEAAAVQELGASLRRAAGRSDHGAVRLSCSTLKRAPRAVGRCAVRAAIEEAGGLRGVSMIHVERILDLVFSRAPSGRRVVLPERREAVFEFDEVWIGPRRTASAPFTVDLPIPGRVVLPDGTEVSVRPTTSRRCEGVLCAVLPRPEGGLVVRSRRPGDRIRHGRRDISLKKFLIERRVPLDRRSSLPLLASGDHVLWVPGQPAPEPGPGRLVRVEVVLPAARRTFWPSGAATGAA
jgi:tRNA(Ile)-lysidine synthase